MAASLSGNILPRLRATKVFATLLLLGFASMTIAVAVTAPPRSPGPEDPGAYIAAHQAALAPYFNRNGPELLSQAAPLLLEMGGRILLVAFLASWCVDIFLARGFATLFAPASNDWRSAVAFATGVLALNVFVSGLLGAGIVRVAGTSQFSSMLLLLVITALFVGFVFQVVWICYRFQTAIPLSSLFHLTLFVVQAFAILACSAFLLSGPADSAALAFMNDTVAADMENAARDTRAEEARQSRDQTQLAEQARALQGAISENEAEQENLKRQIADAQQSESYLFSRIVLLHARGELAPAHDQLAALLARFPTGPMTGLVEGQLIQVTSELSAQAQQRSQAEATRQRLAAQARADLLARAGQGKVTLSEMRKTLLGKSRAEVMSLLGSPVEIASNRWGYGQPMIFNPLTNEKSGLAIYFTEGRVQGVDYYSGSGGTQ